ncbi:MAG: hypothetical protein IKU25_02035 [Clostridia bacterium]|nr:hypothetical protein [Clostridia bacterium]
MKKALTLIFVIVLIVSSFSLAACDNEGGVVPTTITTTMTTTTNRTTTTTKNNTTTEPASTTTTTKNNTTTEPASTTTTTKPVTIAQTTDNNDRIAAQMMRDAKCLKYYVDAGEKLLISSDTHATTYRVLDCYEDCCWFILEVDNWMKTVSGLSNADGIKQAFAEYGESYFEDNVLLMIEQPSPWQPFRELRIEDICLNGSNLNVYIYNNSQGGLANDFAGIFFINMPKDVASEIENINVNVEYEPWDGMIYKPVIYLYPEEEMNVCVRLGYEEKITVSYPEYVDGWNVFAKPDGKLVYNETGRNLYSLYYESENVVEFKVEDNGFVVKSEDTVEFLEEKLAVLGLNEYEAEEFIIYWLPILQANEYNYIRFATADEIERNMPLEINPDPDTIIRVIMTYKGLDAPIKVAEQELVTPDRTGFVAVEWGGTQII